MNRTVSAELQIKAADRTGRVLQQVGSKLNRLDRQAAMVGRRQAMVATAAGNAQAAALAAASRVIAPAAIAYGVSNAVRRFASLEDGLTDLGIVTGATDAQLNKAKKTLQSVGPPIGYLGGELVAVTQELAAAGMEFNRAVETTPAVARTAKAASAEMNSVAATANAVMQQFGVTVSDLQLAFDMMAEGGKVGQFELRDMAAEFPSLTASAAKLGYEGTAGVAKLVAQLEIARKATGTGAEAANNMLNAFEKIYDPSTIKNFAKFNVNLIGMLEEAGETGENQFDAVLDSIEKMTAGMTDAQRAARIAELFPDRQARAAIQVLLRFRDELRDTERQVLASGGAIERDLARRLENASSKWDQMTAAADRTAVRLGEGVAPAAKAAADEINRLFDEAEKRQGGLVDKVWDLGEGLVDFVAKTGGSNALWRNPVLNPAGFVAGVAGISTEELLFGKTQSERTEYGNRQALRNLFARQSEITGTPVEDLVKRAGPRVDAAEASLAAKRAALDPLRARRADQVALYGEDHPAVAQTDAAINDLTGQIDALARSVSRVRSVIDGGGEAGADMNQLRMFGPPTAPLPRARPAGAGTMVPLPRTRPSSPTAFEAAILAERQDLEQQYQAIEARKQKLLEARDAVSAAMPSSTARDAEAVFDQVGRAAEQDLGRAAAQSMDAYTAELRSKGNMAIAEAERIMRQIKSILGEPIRPNIQMPSGGGQVRANVGRSMPNAGGTGTAAP